MIKNRAFLEKTKVKIKSILLIGVVFAGSGVQFACSEDETNKKGGIGEIQVTLATDSGVNAITKAVTETDPNAPSLTDFTINISGQGYNENLSYSELAEPIELPIGTYAVKAISGDATAEGFIGENGYDKPWYQDDQTIVVEGNKTTPANLSATLQNAKVSVSYSEAFIAYFDDYTTDVTLKSSKNTFLFDRQETYEPLYLLPGTLELYVDISGNAGIEYTHEDSFTIDAKKHYKITFDTDADPGPEPGEEGEAGITITFESPDDADPIVINLGNYPVLKAIGFENNRLQIVQGNHPEESAYISIAGKGEITNCSFTIVSSDFTAKTIDLLTADEAALEGLVYTSNTEKTLAVLNFAEVIPTLSRGEHTFTLTVANAKASQKITVTITVA
ncbi:MAG: DUF4493 domain-containing protein [Tannerellaceae bacterium]|nr:DUF4493 domain-containing protein [Tannerellaceae bacterium]